MRTPVRRRSNLRLEPLESRDAPATMVSPTKLTYQDIDGDNVTVVFSKPILNAGNVDSIFTFDTGTVDGSNSTKQQLRAINLAGMGLAAGTAITVTAERSPANGGDGFAAVGQIDATGIDLRAVTIDGDLGRILAGDATAGTTGLKGLTAQSMGRFGTSTGATDLVTTIVGRLAFLKVKSDVKEASILVHGGANGRIGSVFVGGSLIGGAADYSGTIWPDGNLGPVTIRGNLTGGGGYGSGSVFTVADMGTVTVGGSVSGGSGNATGVIAARKMGFVTILGNLVGGSFAGGPGQSGDVSAARLAGVRIGGSVIGGTGHGGTIHAGNVTGFVTIVGNLVGGSNWYTGELTANGRWAGVRIGGSVIGGTGNRSGCVFLTNVGNIIIGGDLVGGSGTGTTGLTRSGFITANNVGSLILGGSLIAGTHTTPGFIQESGAVEIGHLGTVLIKGNIIGNEINPAIISAIGQATPTATADVAIGSLRVLGRVEFGQILAGSYRDGQSAVNADAQIGSVFIGGDWIASSIAAGAMPGGDGAYGTGDDVKMSGTGIKDDPQVISKIGSLTIGGQVIGTVGGTDHFGIVAETVGAVTVGGTALGLDPGFGKDDFFIGITGDVKVHEI